MPAPRIRSLSSLLDTSNDFSAAGAPTGKRPWCSSVWHRQRGDSATATILLTGLLVVGSVLGLILPASDDLHGPYRRVSAIIGWTYFLSWSVSFYPQVLLNFQRKTSVGVSFDFLLYNVLAFSCYAAFTCSLFWSKDIQRAYDKRHEGRPNKVQLNDAVFASHAAFISLVTLLQAMYYDWQGRRQRPSFSGVVTCIVVLVCALAYSLAVVIGQLAFGTSGGDKEVAVLNWLDFLYFLSYVKVGTGILKYVPQVALNMRRRSTTGWTIWNVILDLVGGLLSVVQLILDCWSTGDWGGIRGYPVKFAIGLVSVFFDIIFLLQHYVLYPHPKIRDDTGSDVREGPQAPLLVQGSVQEGEGWWIERDEDKAVRKS